MKTALVYASVHHGNTKKLAERIAAECGVELVDAVMSPHADLSGYDKIGFASGSYFNKMHQTVLRAIEEDLPEGKDVFLICTYGSRGAFGSAESLLAAKRACIVGTFGCRGFDTYGPFKLIGGIAKGHPDERDLAAAVAFVRGIIG
ncbi:MAG: flavodoxin family protein [Clostridia bacterium]|nr:flavodoxin family protein [Clostridia bacterium]